MLVNFRIAFYVLTFHYNYFATRDQQSQSRKNPLKTFSIETKWRGIHFQVEKYSLSSINLLIRSRELCIVRVCTSEILYTSWIVNLGRIINILVVQPETPNANVRIVLVLITDLCTSSFILFFLTDNKTTTHMRNWVGLDNLLQVNERSYTPNKK